jgi:uncharacterized protein YyaL (SSP411 family)
VCTPKAGVFAEGQASVMADRIIARHRVEASSSSYGGTGICYVAFGWEQVGRVEVTFLAGASPRAVRRRRRDVPGGQVALRQQPDPALVRPGVVQLLRAGRRRAALGTVAEVTNRLASATSPYLLQHADNPVDWWEWTPQAFEEARRRDVPVLLSVGYAACHWCHVMAHECFEDEATAAAMNEAFVNIKVDREERPDIDAVYMEATTAMTGHGGWPMTCLLTPDGAPFFAGTYFPRPQFQQLITAATAAWTQRRDEVVDAGQRIVSALSEGPAAAQEHPLPTLDTLDAAAAVLADDMDMTRGGFGGAPKFPPSMVLEFLLRHHARTRNPAALTMVDATCEAMARGGMYDQLAGGFARYSVDADWVVPHFEKMLYDNALLLRVYVHWWRTTGTELALRVVRQTAEFLLRDMRTPEGGFASALDADTEGVEGLTYVWTPAQLAEVLGPEDGAWAARLFAVTAEGTFEHGTSTLQLRTDPDDPRRYADMCARLLEARGRRPQPGRDDKVVTSWNGLAIAALADAGALLEEPRYVEAARECANLLLRLHLVDGRLSRTSRDGARGQAAGVAQDYGDLAEGLLALHQATADPHWLTAAGELLDTATTRFARPDGGYFDTADDAEQLVRRPWDPTDNVTPSGQSSLAGALLTYSALMGSDRHRELAEGVLSVVSWLGPKQPRFLGWACAVAEAALAGPLQIAVVGEGGSGPLTSAARRAGSPGAVVVSGDPDQPGLPLLAMRPLVAGAPAAYVCRGFVCDLPVTTAEEVRQAAQ